ncbi:hypothetical protein M0R45_010228 [Rubus argutus]|uniref:RING-type E3 ubiquitin transferase n=1 Tax=Rubus argutus TaxID=59490 RepID=A0AAW1Y9S2_RUBAR
MENTSSSSSYREIRHRFSQAKQRTEPYPLKGEGFILISIAKYTRIGTKHSSDSRFIYDEPTLLDERKFWGHLPRLKLSTHRSKVTQTIVDSLSSMCVPEDLHQTSVEKLFEVVDFAVSPELPIDLCIWDMTLRIAPGVVNAARESRPSLIPATTCSIEALEKVRFDSLTAPPPMCAICLEDFGGAPDDDDDQPITRLPCSHYFHGDCVVRWLRISHRCPLCRHRMPTV